MEKFKEGRHMRGRECPVAGHHAKRSNRRGDHIEVHHCEFGEMKKDNPK